MSTAFETLVAEDLALIEEALQHSFPQEPRYDNIQEAMEYSLLAGGKRVRPLLVLESCRLCGGDVRDAIPFACAVEMIHTYSLIHDDLPAMDDDDLRRGRLTSHKVYGEATAILAGDGLLTGAFEMLTTANLPAERIVLAVRALSEAAGHLGMIGGQVLDMAGEGGQISLDELTLMQSLKTGALIKVACRLGLIAANGNDKQGKALDTYAMALGRAFQVRDDMLDIISTDDELGKPIGSDFNQHKSTFVTLLGLDRCESLVSELTNTACEALAIFSSPEFHRTLAQKMATRRH